MSDIKKFLDYEGVKHLWSKISMKDYPNNETLVAVINAIDETKADLDHSHNDLYYTKDEIDSLITVEDIDSICVSLITFTFMSTSYQAEEGMTWAEWVESDYNTVGAYIQDNWVYVDPGRYVPINPNNDQWVSGDMVIEAITYSWMSLDV